MTNAEQIARDLRMRIWRREFAPGEQLPLRTELEAAYGASSVTVQSALDNLQKQGIATAKRRLGTFVTDSPATLFQMGMVFYNTQASSSWTLYEQAFLDAARRISADASPWRYRCFFGLGSETEGDCSSLVSCIQQRELAGLLFPLPPSFGIDTPILDEPELPRVQLSPASYTTGVPVAELNIWSAYRLGIERLLAAGCRKPLILRVPGQGGEADFPARLHDLLGEYGLDGNRNWIQATSLHPEWLGQLLCLVFESPGEKPDSLLLTDDNLVVPVVKILAELGIRVPDDFYLVSHANFPCLPKVDLPVDYVGFHIGQVVDELTNRLIAMGEGRKAPMHTTVQPLTAAQAEVLVSAPK